jgi:hypothetical protein
MSYLKSSVSLSDKRIKVLIYSFLIAVGLCLKISFIDVILSVCMISYFYFTLFFCRVNWILRLTCAIGIFGLVCIVISSIHILIAFSVVCFILIGWYKLFLYLSGS